MASFSLDMKKATENLSENIEEIIQGTLFGVFSRIIIGTPVGDPTLWKSPAPVGYIGGTLRGAWNASIGTPDFTVTNSKDKTGGNTVNEMAVRVQTYELGQTLYLTNPQPYAERVEYGRWSSQRPAGMVRVAIGETQQILDQQANRT